MCSLTRVDKFLFNNNNNNYNNNNNNNNNYNIREKIPFKGVGLPMCPWERCILTTGHAHCILDDSGRRSVRFCYSHTVLFRNAYGIQLLVQACRALLSIIETQLWHFYRVLIPDPSKSRLSRSPLRTQGTSRCYAKFLLQLSFLLLSIE